MADSRNWALLMVKVNFFKLVFYPRKPWKDWTGPSSNNSSNSSSNWAGKIGKPIIQLHCHKFSCFFFPLKWFQFDQNGRSFNSPGERGMMIFCSKPCNNVYYVRLWKALTDLIFDSTWKVKNPGPLSLQTTILCNTRASYWAMLNGK